MDDKRPRETAGASSKRGETAPNPAEKMVQEREIAPGGSQSQPTARLRPQRERQNSLGSTGTTGRSVGSDDTSNNANRKVHFNEAKTENFDEEFERYSFFRNDVDPCNFLFAHQDCQEELI